MKMSSAFVQRHWNDCNVLRDYDLSYGDYVEQLTFLLLLIMADEAFARGHPKPPFNRPLPVPKS
jgi:type I restriction enzyme M protein